MASIKRDPLLGGTDFLLTMVMVVLGVAAAVLPLALVGLWLGRQELLGGVVDVGARVGAASAVSPGAVSGILVGGFAIVALAFAFTRELRAVVRSVGVGEAFSQGNAARLTRMAWLAVALNAAAVLVGFYAWVMGPAVGDARDGWNVDLSGVVLALVLFILARVFRQGAAMRADLEGTV